MRWKQFFLPVQSVDPDQAKEMIRRSAPGDLEILDVRQPREYERGHLPGAKLIPLPELDKRLPELDAEKAVIVYCASGGRSRIAAQTLADRGFEGAYNLKGGFRAWEGRAAVGPEDTGMHVFSGEETLPDILLAAYSLEQGLQDFYRLMAGKAQDAPVRKLFEFLAGIEDKHKDRLFQEYQGLTNEPPEREDFESRVVAGYVEGGMTTPDYFQSYRLDMGSRTDVLDMAMTVEAQALDLYRRAADRFRDSEISTFFLRLSEEEKEHLARLGQLMDEIPDSDQ